MTSFEKLKEVNQSLNAVVSYLDVKTSNEGLLEGWDIALKDNFNLEGSLTTASSKILENHQSIYTATSVTKLLDAGAHLVAKASMDELGMGGTNLSALTGPVSNPYDVSRISGGSSGGSAALVGAGAVRAATGTDTGDSIRKPAAYCGVVGLKPTYGRISRYGVIPYASSLDHVGFFTRNVSDAATMLEVMAGRDNLDMTSSSKDVEAYSQNLTMDLKGKRVGIFKSVHDHVEDARFLEKFHELSKQLEAQGAELVVCEMDEDLLTALLPIYNIISNSEAVANHANLDGVRFGVTYDGDSLESIMTQTRSRGFNPQVKKRFILGAYALDNENQEVIFNQAKRVRRLIVDTYTKFFDDVDVVMSLASSQIAPHKEGPFMDVRSKQYIIVENHMVMNNFTGYPSITIPLATVDSMPIGLNISAKAFDEANLLAFAQECESLIDWKGITL